MKRWNSQADIANVTQIKAFKRGKIVDVAKPLDANMISSWDATNYKLRLLHHGDWMELDCKIIMNYPEFGAHIVRALETIYRVSSIGSVKSVVKNIRAGFFRFLAFKGVESNFSIEDIRPQFISQFKDFLDSPNARVIVAPKKGQPKSQTLSVVTRRAYSRALLICLMYACRDNRPELKERFSNFENILYYPNAHKKAAGVPRMTMPSYLALGEAIQLEIRQQVDRYFSMQDLLSEGRLRLQNLETQKPWRRNPFKHC